MADYTLDKYDFKKYLLENLKDTRQDELIFWKNTIPMPVDLIYNPFDKRGILLRKYLDHIGAVCLYAYVTRIQGMDWIAEVKLQPNSGNLDRIETIKTSFKEHLDTSGVGALLSDLAELLPLENYHYDEMALAEALCHRGRNYKRLYIPPALRTKIKAKFPELLDHIAISNGDMFSNVVADELKVYRMGFADGFVGIFNTLIDLILSTYTTVKKGYSTVADFKIVQVQAASPDAANNGIVYGKVTDGSIWEPVYSGGKTSFILNQLHPFCHQLRKQGHETEKLVGQLISVLADRENQIIRDSDKKLIEIFRQDISRELRLKSENENI